MSKYDGFKKIGSDVIIFDTAKIVQKEVVSIGDRTKIDDFVFINGGKGVTLGKANHVCSFVSIIGCGGMATVPLSNYTPVFTGDHSVYIGKSVYLMNFENHAEDTTIWYYFSTDRKVSYGIKDLIHNYFWYGLRDALVGLGMDVTDVDNPDPKAPAMWITLVSVTDEQFQVKVTIQRLGEPDFVKTYRVEEPPLPSDDRTPANLEKRAYHMTNRLFETILNDAEFMKIFS